MIRRVLFVVTLCFLLGVDLSAQRYAGVQGQLTAVASATGCPGAGCLTLAMGGSGAVAIQIQGTFVGTVSFEGSVDGATFVALGLTPIGTTTPATSATTTGVWSGVNVGGLAQVRARMSAYTSGTAIVNVQSAP